MVEKKEVKKQLPDEVEEQLEAESIPEEEEETGVEKKIDSIFKALADLQTAVKDLASAVSAGAEATRGYAETMGEIKGMLEKAISVGRAAVSAENIAADKLRQEKAPQVSETAEPVKTPPQELKEPAEHLYEKAQKVETPRPEVGVVEVKKEEAPENSIIRDVLARKIKGGEAFKQVFELVRRGG